MKAGGVGGGLFLPVLLVLVALDQISKFLVEGRMRLGLEVPIVPGLFSLTRVHNTGVAFGMAQGNRRGWRRGVDPDVDPIRMRDIGSVGLKFLVL
ncbi:MAG: hypothetical protein EBT75_10985, partial [Proteobacteria bacterium]|nr:hypothetical protein [Pseudomonadota bacterium]